MKRIEDLTENCIRDLSERLHLRDFTNYSYFPRFLTIETIDNCNAHCIMCPKGLRGTRELRLMSDDLFYKIVEELKFYNNWIEMVCMNSDGEPLLDKLIAQRIQILKNIGIRYVDLSTNASLLDKELSRELIDSGLDDIRISLDGYTKETYERIRKGLDYNTVVKNVHDFILIRNKMKSKISIRLRMVKMNENKEEQSQWLSYWKKQCDDRLDRVQLMPMHTWSGTVKKEEWENIEYYADKPCVSVFSSMAIDYDGVVQLCDSDVERKEVLGSIEKNTIEEIWRSERFEEIRAWHLSKQRNRVKICQGCDHWSRKFEE